MSKTRTRDSESLVRSIARVCHERRGGDIVALDVRELVEYMDFLLIVTGRSARQNRAISEVVIRERKREDDLPISRAGVEGGSWICLDYFDVVLHIFDDETREHYDLELLWADAKPFDLELPAAAVTVDVAENDADEPYEEGVIEPPRD